MEHSLKHINESWFGLFYDDEPKDKNHIKKIDMVSTAMNKCKIYFDGNSIYSRCKFYPGDIIEVCPTKQIDKCSLYSKDMRDIVFEVIPNELFVIPFGYCLYYDIIKKKGTVPNCDYFWDETNKTIVIKALQNIDKYNKLILNVLK